MNRGVRFGINQKVIVLWVLICVIFPLLPITQAEIYGNTWTGPWIDRLVLEVIQDETQQILALIDDEVDIIGNQIDPEFVDQLQEANIENIKVYENLRFGYGLLYFNCMRYPMNITAFRRALAFAVDKYRISNEAWNNRSVLLDCHIPRQHPACIDDEMEYHYYDKQIEKGIELLEAAGFIDSDDDGWREGPGPEGPGTIELQRLFINSYTSLSREKDKILLDEIVQSLISLGIHATHQWSDIYPNSGSGCPIFRDSHMFLREYDWDTFDLNRYARDLSSDYIEVIGYNPSNWFNESWDAYAATVLSSSDYDEILHTVDQMESIWVHACPAIVLYQNMQYTVCRTDTFQGEIFSNYLGIANYYTNIRIHQKNTEQLGGVYRCSIPCDTYSFNHFRTDIPLSNNILQMIFDPLVRIGPNHEDILWMCESYEVLHHDDDESVPQGHTRIIVEIVKNATWNDGTPITAHDFMFTLSFIRNHVPTHGFDLDDLSKMYLIDNNKFACEFDSESYWNWHSIAHKSVIPQQVWNNYTEDYTEYNPSVATLLDMVTSGPFIASAWVQTDFVEYKQNPYYWKNPRNIENESTPITTISDTTTTHNTMQSLGPPLAIIGSFVCVVTIGVVFLRYIDRRS